MGVRYEGASSQSGPSPQKPNLLQQPVVHGLEALHSWAWATTAPKFAVRAKARSPASRPGSHMATENEGLVCGWWR